MIAQHPAPPPSSKSRQHYQKAPKKQKLTPPTHTHTHTKYPVNNCRPPWPAALAKNPGKTEIKPPLQCAIPPNTPQMTVDRLASRLAGNTRAIANTEAVAQRCSAAQRCSVKRMLVSQNSQEDTCARVPFQ